MYYEDKCINKCIIKKGIYKEKYYVLKGEHVTTIITSTKLRMSHN